MSFKTFIRRKAEKALDKIPSRLAKNISTHILLLESNPYPINSKKFVGEGGYRLRISSFRVIYTVDKKRKEVTILRVADRKSIYK